MGGSEVLYAVGGQDSKRRGLGTADNPWADMRLRVLRVWCNWPDVVVRPRGILVGVLSCWYCSY